MTEKTFAGSPRSRHHRCQLWLWLWLPLVMTVMLHTAHAAYRHPLTTGYQSWLTSHLNDTGQTHLRILDRNFPPVSGSTGNCVFCSPAAATPGPGDNEFAG